MLLCVALIVIIPYIGTARPSMIADKLSNTPEKYFVVTDADPVLVQAISHLGKPISFDSLDETEIGDLAYQYGTSNIEYQNNYYSVGVLVSEPSPIHILTFWASIIGLIMSTALLIYLAIRKRTEMANTNEKAIFG
jgi:hypothetical protein